MLRFGIIDQVDPSKAKVRVRFEEDDIVSDWLPVAQTGSLKNKAYHLPDIGEHVVCLMDKHNEAGAVMGAIYNTQDTPGFDTSDKVGMKFEDGTEIYYDRGANEYVVNSTGKVKVTAASDVEITCDKLKITGDVEITGDVDITGGMASSGGIEAQGEIKSLTDVKAITVSLKNHIHSGVTPGGGTTAIPVP